VAAHRQRPQRQPGGGSRPLLPWRARKDQAGSGSLDGQGWIHNWWIKSKLIDGNDQLCGDIQPGSTETHQLLYTVPKNRPAITGVTLGHRAPGSDDFTFAFVARQLHSGSAAVSNGQNDWLTSVRQLPN
jgi:hypothetical protein